MVMGGERLEAEPLDVLGVLQHSRDGNGQAIDGQYHLIHKDYQVVIEKIAGHTS